MIIVIANCYYCYYKYFSLYPPFCLSLSLAHCIYRQANQASNSFFRMCNKIWNVIMMLFDEPIFRFNWRTHHFIMLYRSGFDGLAGARATNRPTKSQARTNRQGQPPSSTRNDRKGTSFFVCINNIHTHTVSSIELRLYVHLNSLLHAI